MNRDYGFRLIIIAACILLSACQSTQQAWDRMRIKQAQDHNVSLNTVQIFCTGAEECEFSRLDQVDIVHPETKRVNAKAIRQGWVAMTTQASSDHAMFLKVPAKQHELVVRFYPISKDKAEVFHLIHRFEAKQRYTLKMYRQRANHMNSLLKVSAPTPLCVDLVQEQKTLRRFCRPYDVLTGVSEFVEQKI